MRILIAASSQGLGASVAMQCALEGARIAINGRRPGVLAKTASQIRESTASEVLAIPADVSRPDDVRRLVEDTARQFGGIDILITGAGNPPAGAFERLTPEDWQTGINLALMSTVNLIRIALPIMRLSESPVILAIVPAILTQAGDNQLLSHSISMAVAGLVKNLANEVGRHNVRINAILPGWTRTEHVTRVLKEQAQAQETTVQEVLKARTASIPLRRMAEPEEFGRVAAFLCSPAASYVHGAVIPVDGGATGSIR